MRPTPDRLREALFNILSPLIEGAVFVDAYAGSGAVGIEALSRGAARTVFIESSREAAAIIGANLDALKLRARATLVNGSVRNKLPAWPGDIVFLDPPFAQTDQYAEAMDALGQRPPGGLIVIAQHSTRFRMGEVYGSLERYREVRQGENTLSFYRSRSSTGAPTPQPSSLAALD